MRRANSVAFDVRENGRVKTEDGSPTGKKVLDEKGEPVRIPGMLKHVKAIGWYVEEYGIAQVSMNLTNIAETPLHVAFDACCEAAAQRGLRVTGSEVVGMLPKKCLVEAGRYFLRKQQWSEGAAEEELIDLAIRSMGLSELKPFDPKEKVIEYRIDTGTGRSLVKMDLRKFCNETLSDSPAPGGGSVAALMGALGASLGGMVANLSAGKRGWDDKLEFFSEWAVKGQKLKDELLFLVDEDTAAFNKVMAAFGLPKDSAEEKAARTKAIQKANQYAAEIPLKVMETASRTYDLLAEMAEKGNPASISDVGVGLLATRACIEGAAMNVRINLSSLKDEKVKAASAGEDEPAEPQNPKGVSKPRGKSSTASCDARSLNSLAVLHASQLVTLAGSRRPRIGGELGDLGIIEDGGMLVRDGVITAVGTSDEIERQLPGDVRSRRRGRPGGAAGFRGCARSSRLRRAIEWMNSRCGRAARPTKRLPPRVAGFVRLCARPARRAKRSFSLDAQERANWFLRCGTTTMEAKSGYGLSPDEELKILRVIRQLKRDDAD